MEVTDWIFNSTVWIPARIFEANPAMSIVWYFNSFFSRVRANIFLLNPFLFFTRSIKMSNEPSIIFPCTLREEKKALKRYMNFQLSLFLNLRHSRGFSLITLLLRGDLICRMNFQRSPLVWSQFIPRVAQNAGWIFDEFTATVVLLRKSGCYTFSRQESVYNNYHYTIITILNQHFVKAPIKK